MKSKLLAGTATAALSLALFSHATSAATLDDVMRRLDKLEKENAELRKQVHTLQGGAHAAAEPAPVAVVPAPGLRGNPVMHAGVAPSPAPPPPRTIAGIPVKAGPLGPI